MAATGSIVVQNPDDVTQLIVSEAGQGSYNDEQNIQVMGAPRHLDL
jgi:hypothetical protein